MTPQAPKHRNVEFILAMTVIVLIAFLAVALLCPKLPPDAREQLVGQVITPLISLATLALPHLSHITMLGVVALLARYFWRTWNNRRLAEKELELKSHAADREAADRAAQARLNVACDLKNKQLLLEAIRVGRGHGTEELQQQWRTIDTLQRSAAAHEKVIKQMLERLEAVAYASLVGGAATSLQPSEPGRTSPRSADAPSSQLDQTKVVPK